MRETDRELDGLGGELLVGGGGLVPDTWVIWVLPVVHVLALGAGTLGTARLAQHLGVGIGEGAGVDVSWYFDELFRVMRNGAKAVIHYPSIDRAQLEDAYVGWRGDVTSAQFLQALEDAGFKLLHDHYEPWISSTNTSVAIFEK